MEESLQRPETFQNLDFSTGTEAKVLLQNGRWWFQNQYFSSGTEEKALTRVGEKTFQNLDFSTGPKKGFHAGLPLVVSKPRFQFREQS